MPNGKFEEKDMSGVLFINKEKVEKQPDFKGHALINGQKYWVSSWKKVSQKGQKYLSLSFTLPQVGGGQREQKRQNADDMFGSW